MKERENTTKLSRLRPFASVSLAASIAFASNGHARSEVPQEPDTKPYHYTIPMIVQDQHSPNSTENIFLQRGVQEEIVPNIQGAQIDSYETPEPAETPAPKTPTQSQQQERSVPENVWDALAQCESGGNWGINTGNGYYGGLQFDLGTWYAVGGTGLPSEASREEQIARAEILRSQRGFAPWPGCRQKLGLP